MLMLLERHGMLTFRDAPDKAAESKSIDLRQIPFYVINCRSDSENRERMRRQLSKLGLQFEFI